MSDPWWNSGIRFECQGSGRCCVSHGEYGFVYLSKKDRIRMAQALGISTIEFQNEYCRKTDGIYHLIDGNDGNCRFLENKKCTVYEGRPTQCRTWPFWPETMNAKTWKKEVASFCPGVGKGPLVSAKKIAEQIDEQQDCEDQLGT